MMMIEAKLFLAPLPKRTVWSEEILSMPTAKPLSVHGAPEGSVFKQEIRRVFGRRGGADLRIECHAAAVAAPVNAEQAYELELRPGVIRIAANTPVGVLYALSTLRQLRIAPGRFQCAAIYDYPDVELRIAARPLLCGEGGRDALEWGDGRVARLARWRHEIDFALTCRYNGIFCHGFDWNTRIYPTFARDMRNLNRYARARGVRLIFGGYGIGTGGWGGDNYLGEAHNFVPGAGHSFKQDYPCSQNNPNRPETAYNGTCRSNPGLRAQKIRDIMHFIRTIEPGALYIHHEDQSNFDTEFGPHFWLKRCPACRAKWPNDVPEAADGGAGAIADSYDVFGEAREAAAQSAGAAAADCALMVISPSYGQIDSGDATWRRLTKLWVHVAQKMTPRANVYLGFREQLVDFAGGTPRLSDLTATIHRISPLKVMVFAVGGAALYGDNAAFSSRPRYNGYFAGVDAVFNFSGILFQRPQQLFNGECTWNAVPRPDGEVQVPLTERSAAWQQYAQTEHIRQFIDSDHQKENGWLAKACRLIYGPRAGALMFRYQLLRTEHGDFPLAILYMHATMERLMGKLASPPNPGPPTLRRRVQSYADEAARWSELAAITDEGAKLVAEARRHVRGYLGVELERQERQLQIGKRFALLTASLYRQNDGADIAREIVTRQWDDLHRAISELPRDYPAITDGDGALYELYCEGFAKWIAAQFNGGESKDNREKK